MRLNMILVKEWVSLQNVGESFTTNFSTKAFQATMLLRKCVTFEVLDLSLSRRRYNNTYMFHVLLLVYLCSCRSVAMLGELYDVMTLWECHVCFLVCSILLCVAFLRSNWITRAWLSGCVYDELFELTSIIDPKSISILKGRDTILSNTPDSVALGIRQEKKHGRHRVRWKQNSVGGERAGHLADFPE